MTETLETLVQALRVLPSVGEKSAWRMALHLLDREDESLEKLAEALLAARQKVHRCPVCFTWCEGELCSVCSSMSRDRSQLCVVERPRDMWALESRGQYRGLYHVLGGVLSPINGVTVDSLRLRELVYRIGEGEVTEVILGLSGTSEAETTAHYIAKILEPFNVVISRFSRGLSAGMELEYADRSTLDRALAERRVMQYGEQS